MGLRHDGATGDEQVVHSTPEQPLDYEEVARRTGMSVDWAMRHLDTLPHHRPSPRRVSFTQDVDDYLASVRHILNDPFQRPKAARQKRV